MSYSVIDGLVPVAIANWCKCVVAPCYKRHQWVFFCLNARKTQYSFPHWTIMEPGKSTEPRYLKWQRLLPNRLWRDTVIWIRLIWNQRWRGCIRQSAQHQMHYFQFQQQPSEHSSVTDKTDVPTDVAELQKLLATEYSQSLLVSQQSLHYSITWIRKLQ